MASKAVARDLGFDEQEWVEVAAVATESLIADGPDQIEEISRYEHLSRTVGAVEKAVGATIEELNQRQHLLLDVYTCYPVVPMALLFAAGLVSSAEGFSQFLARQSITQTGGMNLARGAWNNPALNGLIAMVESLQAKPRGSGFCGLVHGNGGLGYRQGVALLKQSG